MRMVAINDNFEMILECAERYAIGRHSYWPLDCVAYIRGLLKDLTRLEQEIPHLCRWWDELR